jgi:hypothetical protein
MSAMPRPKKIEITEPTMIVPEGVAFRVVDDGEDEEGEFQTIEFTVPIPAAETVMPAEQWTDEELFRVRKFGPAIIGQEMYEAKERRIKLTGDGKLGPALTLSADEHEKAIAAHQAKLAERQQEVERRTEAAKAAKRDAYATAMLGYPAPKPAA